MKSHAARFKLISLTLIVSALVWLGLTIGATWEASLLETDIYKAAAYTSVLVLFAWLDALGVEKRRRTPGFTAISDDVPADTTPEDVR